MKSRCYSPSAIKGKYKENNIQVCKEWMNSFEQFYFDMGNCPIEFTLERKDNLKDYSKENCIWANRTTQSKNRDDFNDIVTYQDKTMVLKDWAKEFNIKYTTLYQRIYRSGLSFEEAIQQDPFGKLIGINGEKKSLKDWCIFYNIDFKLVNNRISKHKWTPLEALTIPKRIRRTKN
ncbi:MAG: hypothetical protein ACOH2V_00875 [Candidatus Saccharimonadaceae bacterium]